MKECNRFFLPDNNWLQNLSQKYLNLYQSREDPEIPGLIKNCPVVNLYITGMMHLQTMLHALLYVSMISWKKSIFSTVFGNVYLA